MSHDDPAPTPRGTVRRELASLGRRPRKRLGQHFLADPSTAQRIVALARLQGTERVVEIGPGLGALTTHLVGLAGELWLIEVDADLAERLRTQYAGQPHVHVVEADVLRTDIGSLLGDGAPAIAIANLPYNIGTAVLMGLLESRLFSRLVLMVQHEVAERLRARPGSKDYSALSVLTQFTARVDHGMRVGPGAFVPPPKVESEVIIVEPHRTPPVGVRNVATFKRLVRTVFTQRRKQLGNSMRQLCSDPVSVLQCAHIDTTRRPETLTLAEFAALSDALDDAAAAARQALGVGR